jgi:hypothetical protein
VGNFIGRAGEHRVLGQIVCCWNAGLNVSLDTPATTTSNASVVIAAANVPQFVTATFPAQTAGTWSTTNAQGALLRIYLAVSAGFNIVATSGNTFEMTGLILLPGVELPSASRAPFIMRPYPVELPLCQRHLYYSNPDFPLGFTSGNITGVALTSGVLSASGRFPIAMRATPTITAYLDGVSNRARSQSSGGVVTLCPAAFDACPYGLPAYYGSATPFTTGNGYDFDIKADARL